jgi:hypothetical protein
MMYECKEYRNLEYLQIIRIEVSLLSAAQVVNPAIFGVEPHKFARTRRSVGNMHSCQLLSSPRSYSYSRILDAVFSGFLTKLTVGRHCQRLHGTRLENSIEMNSSLQHRLLT